MRHIISTGGFVGAGAFVGGWLGLAAGRPGLGGNCVMSVVGLVLAVAQAIQFCFSIVLLAGEGAYGLSVVAAALLSE